MCMPFRPVVPELTHGLCAGLGLWFLMHPYHRVFHSLFDQVSNLARQPRMYACFHWPPLLISRMLGVCQPIGAKAPRLVFTGLRF